jgi:hypothetical protein
MEDRTSEALQTLRQELRTKAKHLAKRDALKSKLIFLFVLCLIIWGFGTMLFFKHMPPGLNEKQVWLGAAVVLVLLAALFYSHLRKKWRDLEKLMRLQLDLLKKKLYDLHEEVHSGKVLDTDHTVLAWDIEVANALYKEFTTMDYKYIHEEGHCDDVHFHEALGGKLRTGEYSKVRA